MAFKVHTYRMSLYDGSLVVAVNDKSRQTIALTVYEAVDIGW